MVKNFASLVSPGRRKLVPHWAFNAEAQRANGIAKPDGLHAHVAQIKGALATYHRATSHSGSAARKDAIWRFTRSSW